MSKNKYLFAFALVTSLFFIWGFTYGLLDVLNKHFQETLNVTKTRSTLLQAAYFGAYFLIGLIGVFVNKFDYKKGIIFGLLLFAIGAFLFYPAAESFNFNYFLLALFILAAGCGCLETTANPYVTVLGDPAKSANRLNLSQCFNGLGSFFGPLLASQLFFSHGNSDNLDSVKSVYLIIGVVVLGIAFLFIRTKLPEIKEAEQEHLTADQDKKPLGAHPHFIFGVIAQFFYIAAQVGVAALFINYCTESGLTIDNALASKLLAVALFLFAAGRFIGTGLMRFIQPQVLLAVYAIVNFVLCAVVLLHLQWVSVVALMIIFLFESIMFPTIFALGIKGLGSHTKKAASFMIMSIVGGAIVPAAMGVLADKFSTAVSYAIPMGCFLIVAWYGWRGYQIGLPKAMLGQGSGVKVDFNKH
ncbi:L-fucose:H+ symporter permease [Arachidicoccus ginsenosidivorans]|uniref:Sugar MFS transporter n=1 Tax=Arachidicoccus ginsenosidivorans TaxID=496057 RepID=A0A5B8VNA6_9BACT|nr:sugar MFS transporter [Arachidicoccus ginsenosidivorans]QEC72673.1 sugar MFS transporter [Arachidicoccus ginsenosidivorans]